MRRQDAAEVVHDTGGHVVLVDGEDLAERVSAATEGARIRLGIDAVGGAATGRLADCLRERNVGQLRPHERRAVCGATGRLRLPRPDAARLLARELVLARDTRGDYQWTEDDFAPVADAITDLLKNRNWL